MLEGGEAATSSNTPSILSKSLIGKNSSLMPELQIFSRALKDLKGEGGSESAFKSLTQLTESGNFMSVPALVLLVQSGGKSISEAKPFAAELMKRQPEQSDLLRQSLPVSYTHLTLPTICSV